MARWPHTELRLVLFLMCRDHGKEGAHWAGERQEEPVAAWGEGCLRNQLCT